MLAPLPYRAGRRMPDTVQCDSAAADAVARRHVATVRVHARRAAWHVKLRQLVDGTIKTETALTVSIDY